MGMRELLCKVEESKKSDPLDEFKKLAESFMKEMDRWHTETANIIRGFKLDPVLKKKIEIARKSVFEASISVEKAMSEIDQPTPDKD